MSQQLNSSTSQRGLAIPSPVLRSGLTVAQTRRGALKATEKIGKTSNVQRSTPNVQLARSELSVERWTLSVGRFPTLLRPANLISVLLFLLAGCADTTPPAVTPELAARASSKTLTVAQLQHGRRLFASRCIECHTLPVVNAHEKTEWPCLVDWMAKRASLKREERDAVLAYILAARAQQ